MESLKAVFGEHASIEMRASTNLGGCSGDLQFVNFEGMDGNGG